VLKKVVYTVTTGLYRVKSVTVRDTCKHRKSDYQIAPEAIITYSMIHLRGGPKLITINHAIIYRRNWNLASTYLGGCGGNWVTEDAGIGFPAPGDTG
jgi:hypothetical protein